MAKSSDTMFVRAALCNCCPLLFGVAPALRATSLAPASALRDSSRGVVSSGSRLSLGNSLVAAQTALSFVLVLGASLFVRTLVDLTTQEMGFRQDRVLLASVDLRRTGLSDKERPAMFERAPRCHRGCARRRGGRGLGRDADRRQHLEQHDYGAW